MRGYNHALSGVAAWLSLTSTSAAALGLYPTSIAVSIGGSVLAAGAALQPDLDSTEGTIAKSLPGVSRPLSKLVRFLTGGHRAATHSVIGVAAFTAIAWGISKLPAAELWGHSVQLGAGIYAIVLVAFALRVFKLPQEAGDVAAGTGTTVGWILNKLLDSFLGPWLLALATAGLLTWQFGYEWPWLVVAVGVGALVHVMGDALTVQGVPWLWPWRPAPPKFIRHLPGVRWAWGNNGHFRIPILGTTGSGGENFLSGIFGAYISYLVAFQILEHFQLRLLP